MEFVVSRTSGFWAEGEKDAMGVYKKSVPWIDSVYDPVKGVSEFVTKNEELDFIEIDGLEHLLELCKSSEKYSNEVIVGWSGHEDTCYQFIEFYDGYRE